MPHWRGMMESPYLGAWDLVDDKGDPIDVTATIERVTQGEVTNAAKKTSKKPIVFFRGQPKGLVMNVTNCKTVARLYGDDTREWVGKMVALYQAETSAGGETMQCIRIRQKAPSGGKAKAAPVAAPAAAVREPGADDV